MHTQQSQLSAQSGATIQTAKAITQSELEALKQQLVMFG